MSGLRRLVVFGDSYVVGGVDPYTPEANIHKNFTYHLGQRFGIETFNAGFTGGCNMAIANCVMRFITNNRLEENDAFFVCWSDIRREPIVKERYWNEDYENELFIDTKYDKLEHPAIHRIQFEASVHSVRMICHELGIPLIMTNSVDVNATLGVSYYGRKKEYIPLKYCYGNMKEQWIEMDKPNNCLLDIVSGAWLRDDVPNQPFFIKHNELRKKYNEDPSKYPYLTKCFHPNEEGHKLVADTLAPYIQPLLEK